MPAFNPTAKPTASKKRLRKRHKRGLKRNKAEFQDSKAANKFLQKRYGVKIDKLSTDDERQALLSGINNKLKIKPEKIDPGRKINKKRKALAGAFKAIEGLVTSGDEISGTAARGEFFRVAELADRMGDEELEAKANYYLGLYDNSNVESGKGVANVSGALRDIQMLINNTVNVDFLSENANLDRFDDAALNGGLTVNAEGTGLIFGKTFAQATADFEHTQERRQKDIDSNYEPGSRKYGDQYVSDMEHFIENAVAPVESDFASSDKDIPWWAK